METLIGARVRVRGEEGIGKAVRWPCKDKFGELFSVCFWISVRSRDL